MDTRDGNPTVLVVEDDASLRRLVVHMLASGGFEALATGEAAEGLSLVRQRRGTLDLVILDIVMPGMSGLDLASDLDREYPGLKILYMSGYVGSVAAEVLSRRTPEQVLLKPFTEQELLDRVRRLLNLAPQACKEPAPAISNGTAG